MKFSEFDNSVIIVSLKFISMPHYPDEVEYSDKYADDHYEYRHVILPKDIYRRMPRHRILSENVQLSLSRNGDHSEFSSQEDGFTTNFTSQSLTFSSSEDQKEPTLKLDFPQQDSSLLPTPMFIE